MIYFIQTGDDGLIKIGYTDRHVDARLRELQRLTATPLKLRATMNGGFDQEQEIHSRFAPYRQHGEWFTPAPELLELIEQQPTLPPPPVPPPPPLVQPAQPVPPLTQSTPPRATPPAPAQAPQARPQLARPIAQPVQAPQVRPAPLAQPTRPAPQPARPERRVRHYKGPWAISRILAIGVSLLLASLAIALYYPGTTTLGRYCLAAYIFLFIEIALRMVCKIDRVLARWIPLD